MFKCLCVPHDSTSPFDRWGLIYTSRIQDTRTYYFVKYRKKVASECFKESDGCELTLSNVGLWISGKRDINHVQMVPLTTVRSD